MQVSDELQAPRGSQPLQTAEQRALAFIGTCTDAKKLKQTADNAHSQGVHNVERAALLKLYSVLPAASPGTLEHDVWQSVYALEGALKAERGKTTLLARTRQKIARHGELRTVSDLVTGKESAGFTMLIERNMPELTFEALALRHPASFSQAVLEAARVRLRNAGVLISSEGTVRLSLIG